MGVALEFWTSVLQLPLFDIVHAEQHKQERRYTLTVMVQDRRGVCPQCHQVCEKVHQTRNREHIHNLPISGYASDIGLVNASIFGPI